MHMSVDERAQRCNLHQGNRAAYQSELSCVLGSLPIWDSAVSTIGAGFLDLDQCVAQLETRDSIPHMTI